MIIDDTFGVYLTLLRALTAPYLTKTAAITPFPFVFKTAPATSPCSLTSHPHGGSRAPRVRQRMTPTPLPNSGEVTGQVLASIQPRPLPQHLGPKKSSHMMKWSWTTQHNNNNNNNNKYLHAALRVLDGVMQQALESALERPALLHERLVTADTPRGIHAESQRRR